MKSNSLMSKTELSFLVIQAILFTTFLILDITDLGNPLSTYIKFCIIILCFCYALFQGKGADKSIIFVVKAALLFTAVSDLLLLILDHYSLGVGTFIIVQQLYGIRLAITGYQGTKEGEDKAARRSSYIKKIAIILFFQLLMTVSVCVFFLLINVSVELLLIISVFYFISIVTNAIRAIYQAIKCHIEIRNILFAIGMGLFLLCDINVGIFNMSTFIQMPDKVYQMLYQCASVLMWTFYAPSQVLIVLSITKNSDSDTAQFTKKPIKFM